MRLEKAAPLVGLRTLGDPTSENSYFE